MRGDRDLELLDGAARALLAEDPLLAEALSVRRLELAAARARLAGGRGDALLREIPADIARIESLLDLARTGTDRAERSAAAVTVDALLRVAMTGLLARARTGAPEDAAVQEALTLRWRLARTGLAQAGRPLPPRTRISPRAVWATHCVLATLDLQGPRAVDEKLVGSAGPDAERLTVLVAIASGDRDAARAFLARRPLEGPEARVLAGLIDPGALADAEKVLAQATAEDLDAWYRHSLWIERELQALRRR